MKNWYTKIAQVANYGYRGVSNPEQILKTGLVPNWVFSPH